jgi:RNA polymerase sigma factor (sigma-70 family)
MSQSTPSATRPSPELRAAEAALLARHEGLVRWVARRQHLGPLSFPDALHEGRIGLWQALRHYDPSRGTTFSTYAVPAIARAIWRAVAREQGRSPTQPAQPVRAVADADLAEVLQAIAVAEAVRAAVGSLPAPLDAVVIAHLGLDGHAPQSFAAIGARLGRTRQRAQQLYADAVERLAHPAHSLPLRRLTDRLRRADYQRTLARQQRRARARRRPR